MPETTANTDAPTTEQEVTPWTVQAENGVDYDKLINEFGAQKIDQATLDRMEKLSKKPIHPWLKRQLFFSHRSLNDILDSVEKGEPFFLYTGRGPSSEALHLGHLIPFMFTKYLQDAFDVPLVIQLTDDEKFLWKDLSLEETHRLGWENAKDIISIGFDVNKTFIFRNLDYIQQLYPNICKIQKCVTGSQVQGIFGFTSSNNIGQYAFPAIQAAPSFSSCFPHIFGPDSNVRCLIPCAIDQDPFFRMTRDVAPKLGLHKPAVIHSKFFPALTGPKTKMSASDANTTIYVTDSPKQIENKIKKYAFSGGRATMEEHRKYGGDVTIDVPYQYLSVFEMDDAKLEEIRSAYSTGQMLSGEIKQELIKVIQPLVAQHQVRRAAVTDDDVALFMKIRPLNFGK